MNNEDRNRNHVPAQESQETIIQPASMSSIPHLLSFVSTYARGKEFSEKRIGEIIQGLKEALLYILSRGHRDTSGEIQITVSIDMHGRLAIVVSDTGISCNLLLADDPLLGVDPSYHRGQHVGVSLLKKIFDTIEFKRSAGKNIHSLVASKTSRI